MVGCTISPLSGLQLPPVRAYMDDMTILTTRAFTKCILEKLQGNTKWARMEIKPSKSHSYGTSSWEVSHQWHPIPTVLEKPIKMSWTMLQPRAQRHWATGTPQAGYNQWPQAIQNQVEVGKLKLWCFWIWTVASTFVANHHLWGKSITCQPTGEIGERSSKEIA